MKSLPKPYSAPDVVRGLEQWLETAAQQKNPDLSQWMQAVSAPGHELRGLLESVFGNSSYLSRLMLLYPQIVCDLCRSRVETAYAYALEEMAQPSAPGNELTDLKRGLRIGKGKLALLIALADILRVWSLEQVTAALSDLAELALSMSLNALLANAFKRGEIQLPNPENPSQDSGIIILGMGKLGGRELNYSSDIDLIIFYESGRLGYKGHQTEQHFMNRIAHELVALMQERTPNGYVFRTDLRLRPDPASTPPAITTDAAYYYYESVGQNWERAAMIKARPVAGDKAAGERFLTGISPFMWRRNLDFAAINDIHSIKRQMDSLHSQTIELRGHNVKLGIGGIREIEFYVQIHQLIWGGREPALRIRATCEALRQLSQFGLVPPDSEALLHDAYVFLRTLEHRLQMVADEQTHSLPLTHEGIDHIACFMGYDSIEAFEKDLFITLHDVHDIYASSFKSNENPASSGLGNEGNLVFTGVSHDPETLKTLRNLGYEHPETVSEIVMGWHHGSTRATRTKRARELLTEMMPLLLKRLGETVQPDAAFLKFHEFLSHLPAGVQLFSLFTLNPHLLGLIADIMGSAPTLADTLSKSPELLDAVLYEDFYGPLPTRDYLEQQLNEQLLNIHDPEAMLERLRRFRNEKQFQAGVQLLKHMITGQQAGVFLSALADMAIAKTLDIITADFVKTYGTIAGSNFAIIGLGKLGSREMTFISDIDLVFVYKVPDFDSLSDGKKAYSASVYYNRLAQRFLNALTGMGRDGRLYEVDTRLRPSGKQGLLAVSLQAFCHYFDELAWTFEYMAFTKARVIASEEPLHETLDHFIADLLCRQRDATKLMADAANMRERIAKEYDSGNLWDIKYTRGGLLDIDFIAQSLILLHAPSTPGSHPGSASEIFGWLMHSGRLATETAHLLLDADRFLSQLFQMLRLCSRQKFVEAQAPQGLKKLLVESVKEKNFESLTQRLIQVEQMVHEQYISVLRLR